MSLKTHLQAWSDLFGRYKQIFAIAWQNRHETIVKVYNRTKPSFCLRPYPYKKRLCHLHHV